MIYSVCLQVHDKNLQNPFISYLSLAIVLAV